MTSLLESAIKELTTALTRLTNVLDNKKREDAQEQSSPKEKITQSIIPPEPQEVTDVQVRAILIAKRAEGKLEQIQKLMRSKYGAAKFSEIDPAKYAEFLKDAEAL